MRGRSHRKDRYQIQSFCPVNMLGKISLAERDEHTLKLSTEIAVALVLLSSPSPGPGRAREASKSELAADAIINCYVTVEMK